MSGSAKMAAIYSFIFLFPDISLYFVITPPIEDLRGILLEILGKSVDFYRYSSNPLSYLQFMKSMCKPKYFLYYYNMHLNFFLTLDRKLKCKKTGNRNYC